ncbi:MAG TPA: hypothetical protein VFS08_06220 [Gemmatimonadaceae bacterium]|nr:hypothetical protein [Gemmatimonadaceae bacterium]
MASRHVVVLALALVIASTACATGGASAAGEEAGASRARGSRNVLTMEELRASPHTNMMDAVAGLRAHWLRGPGVTSFGNSNAAGGVTVYVDGHPLGSTSTLSSIDVRSVARATYRTTSEAQNRYGSRVTTPVIDIETIKSSPTPTSPDAGPGR